MIDDRLRCLFCGGDPFEPNHEARCDGRQGGRDDDERVERSRVARDAGMALVADKAERTRPTFSHDAQEFIVQYLTANGPTPGEVLTIRCAEAGIKPHDDRAFGPVFMALSRARRIIKAGTMPRYLRGHHAPGCTIWRLIEGVNE